MSQDLLEGPDSLICGNPQSLEGLLFFNRRLQQFFQFLLGRYCAILSPLSMFCSLFG